MQTRHLQSSDTIILMDSTMYYMSLAVFRALQRTVIEIHFMQSYLSRFYHKVWNLYVFVCSYMLPSAHVYISN